MFLYSLSTTNILLEPLFELFLFYSTEPASCVLKILANQKVTMQLMTTVNNHFKRLNM